MQNCVNCQKTIILKFVVSLLNLKATEIAKVVHLSNSMVSKHIAGIKNSTDVDIYLIERIFSIKVKEYTKNDRI